MIDWIFEYSPEIDLKVKSVIPEVLGIKVKSLERISQGEVNYVYKVETERQMLLVRIARYKNWPDIRKLGWIFNKLEEKGISHPKILFSDTSSKYFRFGFMITEWVDGKDGMSLIREGTLSRKMAVGKIAETLRKVHKVSIDGFGKFNGNGKGEYTTWEESLFSFLEDSKYRKAAGDGVYKENLNEKGIQEMKKIIKKLNYQPKPVLTHQDTTPENAIFNGGVTLIDWDNAIGSSWIDDVAWITFWMGKKARRWFLEVYRPQEPLDLIEKVEKIIHVRLAITLIPYYLFSTKNYRAVEKMKRKLRRLVLI